MEPLWVSFIGICTHIWEDQPNADPHPVWGHRIVMVNASNPDTINNNPNLNHYGIKPHFARLQIFNEDIVSIQGPAAFYPFNDTMLLDLNGVTVQVVNNGLSTLAKEARCMPQLEAPALFGPPITGIAPGPAVTMGLSALASCYFDFSFGHVLGTIVDRAPADDRPAECGVILYKTDTIGDPQILITPFEGGSPTLVTLRNSKRDQQGDQPHIGMLLMNLPKGQDDNEMDFLLHYLAANKIPENPPLIFPPVTCQKNPFSYGLFQRMPVPTAFDLSAGCSASNLP